MAGILLAIPYQKLQIREHLKTTNEDPSTVREL